MILLRSEGLLVRLDPRHGGELLDLVHLPSGRQLLGRPPFSSAEPVPGDLDEDTWTAAYRGGWQMALPNAGNACEVGGEYHGFHGRASNDPWDVVNASDDAVHLRWEGHGIEARRKLSVAGDTLTVAVELRAVVGRVPLVCLEHLSVGLELLEPEVEIVVPPGRAYELSERTGPVEVPAEAPLWPDLLLLDGSRERADRWPLTTTRSRYLVVTNVPDQRAAVRNPSTGAGLELSWDGDLLRHVWIWHEARVYDGRWRGQAEILVIEPASVPHGLGLAAAIEAGQACWLEPGEVVAYRLSVRATG
jgi:hypothetical protein